MELDKSRQFQARLKEIYQSQDKIAPLIEGLDEMPEYSMKDYYVRLQTIVQEDASQGVGARPYEEISGEKVPIDISKMFDKLQGDHSNEVPAKLLVLGGAGVGKSTLMQYMVYKWSQGELWNDKFDLVYRVSLKTLLNQEWNRKYNEDETDDLLKCLVHLTISRSLAPKARKEFKLEKMEWPDSKERVLLLLDGYDEISHLKNDKTRDDWDQLFEEIFSHKYLIFSSRPNAVDPDLKSKFNRIIENTGLDYEGIRQYFTKYFQNRPAEGQSLEKFLNTHVSIREICKIPVNIAMLCYSWSQSNSETEASAISNVADLYNQVLKHLGERYFAAKKWKGNTAENQSLKAKFDNGELILDEMKVLRHVAHTAFSGGGIGIDDEDRKETLVIKGAARDKKDMVNKNDEDGISIQSSINYLSRIKEIDSKNKVSINEVYKYGVLRVEGGSLQDKETDLHSQDYSFIHLTFQEYLTANYLKEKLETGDDLLKSEICQYLAEHRNQPRYLMVLKFMAGLITADQKRSRATGQDVLGSYEL